MNTEENDESLIFDKLSSKFFQLLYGRAKENSSNINSVLEDINQLNYHHPIVKNQTKAVLLIHQCCSIIPPDDSPLVSKGCMLMLNLLIHQRVDIEGQTLSLVTQWCLQCLKHPDTSAYIQILSVLKTLAGIKFMLPILINVKSPVISMSRNVDLKIALLATQCIEACTLLSEHQKSQNFEKALETAAIEFINHLNQFPINDCILQNKILVSSLRGLQSVIVIHVEFLKRELNLLLGIAKSYMTYSIKGTNFQVPQKILPSVLNIPETCVNGRERKGGKVAKQRKPKATNKKNSTMLDNDYEDVDIRTKWESGDSKTGTSDSDVSDTEQTKLTKLGYGQDRVRHAALNLLLQIVKLTDKGTIFCYWSNFISDGCSSNNLNICILKDPSPKGRMAALHVLLTLLIRGKSYLNQAESSKKYSAFTPFSVILGAMVTNLHKCLSLALNENCLTVLLQVLKCLAALVQASPYHKLTPGMTKKIIRNVKMYIDHRDVAVQIAALIVLECILGSEPVVSETKVALLRHSSSNLTEKTDNTVVDNTMDSDDIEFVDFSSDDEDEFSETPQHLPWLLDRCLANLGSYSSSEVSSVAPIKVQSLQVISAMTRNFFDCLIVPYLSNIAKALDLCLTDSYVDLRLHAGRTVDFIGQAMNRYLDSTKTFSPEQALLFWQILINKSLPALLQCQQNSVLRAVGCDCLASIGPSIFERFSREKQILIVTLLFPSSRDEDNNVRAAAVRALAICVLYPSLRDDPGFVVDVAETVHRSLHDDCITVRIKASWSLGNLSDVLVLNQDDSDKEEIPAVLLLKLLKVAIKISTDNDKVRVNAVRALGNLLQVLTEDTLRENHFITVVHESLDALLKNCTTGTNMKVRWNSCYAIGNALKNSNLPINGYRSKESLFKSLIDLVKDFPNFKVRINAALALSCVSDRQTYGNYFLTIWKSLLNALENTQNIEDFSEYNHQDHLVEQICLTLGHLTNLLSKGDLQLIKDSIQLHYDLLLVQVHKVLDRLLPEKSTVLLLAGSRLKAMGNEDLSNEQLIVLNNLYKIFITE